MSTVDELLAAPPSEDNWLALCRYIVRTPQDAQTRLAELDTALEHWPDATRHLYSNWYQHGPQIAASLGALARSMTVYRRSEDADRHLQRIAAAPELACLKQLHLDRSELSSLQPLADSTSLTALCELHVSGISNLPPPEPSPAGVFTRLTRLRLSACELDGAALRGWLQAVAPPLANLDLSQNQLTDEDVTPLLAWPGWGTLRTLDVSENRLSAIGQRQLRASWPGTDGLITER